MTLVRIHAIALNTFREAMRKRLLYAILVLVVGVMFLSIYLGEMSLGQDDRLTRDVGVSAIRGFGCLTAIALGSLLLYSEIQRRTIYVIISKPIERHEFMLGKYAGMAATLTLLVALFTAAMALTLTLQGLDIDQALFQAVFLVYIEILLVAALSLFFSSFSGPVLTGVFSFVVWRLGHLTPEMRDAIDQSDATWIQVVSRAALRLVPDMHMFTTSSATLAGQDASQVHDFVPWSYVATAGLYGGLYVAALLIVASVIFGRRDFA